MASSDLESVFYLLLDADDTEFTRRHAAPLWESCEKRFGAPFDAVAIAIREQAARHKLEAAHVSVLDQRGRFWSDALLSADSPEDLVSLVKQKQPHVRDWPEALAMWFVEERFKFEGAWRGSRERVAKILLMWLAVSEQDVISNALGVECRIADAIALFSESPLLMRARSLLRRG